MKEDFDADPFMPFIRTSIISFIDKKLNRHKKVIALFSLLLPVSILIKDINFFQTFFILLFA
jgi:hypothetical protein